MFKLNWAQYFLSQVYLWGVSRVFTVSVRLSCLPYWLFTESCSSNDILYYIHIHIYTLYVRQIKAILLTYYWSLKVYLYTYLYVCAKISHTTPAEARMLADWFLYLALAVRLQAYNCTVA